MSDLKIALAGSAYQLEVSTAQFAILASANAWTFAQVASTNIATITTTNPHGLTPIYTAGTLPNFFVTFQGNITAQTGVGTIIGNTFRILSVPSTTTFTIYTTVTAATAATTAGIVPVFIPVYTPFLGSAFVNGPTFGTPAVQYPYGIPASANCNFTLGANCVVNYYPDNTGLLLDQTTGCNACGCADRAHADPRIFAGSGVDGCGGFNAHGCFRHHGDEPGIGYNLEPIGGPYDDGRSGELCAGDESQQVIRWALERQGLQVRAG